MTFRGPGDESLLFNKFVDLPWAVELWTNDASGTSQSWNNFGEENLNKPATSALERLRDRSPSPPRLRRGRMGILHLPEAGPAAVDQQSTSQSSLLGLRSGCMGAHPTSMGRRAAREAQFARNIVAFMSQDFSTINGSMRSDLVLEVPGSSWLAGTYRGLEEVGDCLRALRRALRPQHDDISFRHGDDEMLVSHGLTVVGPRHSAQMIVNTWVRYDEDDKMAELSMVPSDLGLFDHVINTLKPEPAGA